MDVAGVSTGSVWGRFGVGSRGGSGWAGDVAGGLDGADLGSVRRGSWWAVDVVGVDLGSPTQISDLGPKSKKGMWPNKTGFFQNGDFLS